MPLPPTEEVLDLEQLTAELEATNQKKARLEAQISEAKEQRKAEQAKKEKIIHAAGALTQVLKSDIAVQDQISTLLKQWDQTRQKRKDAYAALEEATGDKRFKSHYEANTQLYPPDFATTMEDHRAHCTRFVDHLKSEILPLAQNLSNGITSSQPSSSSSSSAAASTHQTQTQRVPSPRDKRHADKAFAYAEAIGREQMKRKLDADSDYETNSETDSIKRYRC